MRKLSRQVLTSGIAVLSIGATSVWGCAEADSDEPSSAKGELPLAAVSSVAEWSAPIPVCFETGAKQSVVDSVKSALKYSWPTSSMISYNFLASCPSSGLYVLYALEPVRSWDQIASQSQGTRIQLGYCDAALGGDCTYGDEVLREYAIHEFGHILGFSHEHQRPDRPEDLGSWCIDATAEYMTTYPIECGMQDGLWLSSEYDPSSIMNYCRDQDGDKQADSFRPQQTWNDRLSVRDMRGAGEKYGYRFPAFHLGTLYQ